MRNVRKLLTIVAIWFAFALPVNAESVPLSVPRQVGIDATNLLTMSVTDLRERYCGGEATEGNQDTKNTKFLGCVMYVLGVVDMLREWQRTDPIHAPSACVPRSVTSGQLIIVVQDHIEATAPWREQQNDATTAIIGALKAKWPCPGR